QPLAVRAECDFRPAAGKQLCDRLSGSSLPNLNYGAGTVAAGGHPTPIGADGNVARIPVRGKFGNRGRLALPEDRSPLDLSAGDNLAVLAACNLAGVGRQR